jgi:hypothetical protein
MNSRMEELLARIRELETELEADLEEKRTRFHYHLEDRRARFEQDILALHQRLRTGWLRYLLDAPLSHLLTAPVIYATLLPLLLLDLAVSLYQAVCFPAYGIPRVRRHDHFAFDRGRLPYLNWIERMNCLYCSYANGLLGYAQDIAGRTEQYWCPIKHARRLPLAHPHYAKFFDYGDVEAYRNELERLRQQYPEMDSAPDQRGHRP